MADKRPWAKIDTGYHWNRKWFEIERSMRDAMPNAMPIAVRNALRLARDAHHASILYCRQGATDGVFPVQVIKAMVGVHDDEEDAALTYLFDSGMWINHPGGMAEVRDYLDHQTDAETTKKRSEAARKAAKARWSQHAERNAERNAEKRREEKRINSAFDAWWKHYPKKVGKGDARKAFKAASKKTDQDTLVRAVKQYAISVKGTDRKYIKNPGPWLRDERWEDDLGDTPKNGSVNPYANFKAAGLND